MGHGQGPSRIGNKAIQYVGPPTSSTLSSSPTIFLPALRSNAMKRALGLLPDRISSYAASPDEGVLWSERTDDLNVNLVAWSPPHGIEPHVNKACDVLLVGLHGRGHVEIDADPHPVMAGSVVLIPRGSTRSIVAETRLLYLTSHKRQPETFTIDDVNLPPPGVHP